MEKYLPAKMAPEPLVSYQDDDLPATAPQPSLGLIIMVG